MVARRLLGPLVALTLAVATASCMGDDGDGGIGEGDLRNLVLQSDDLPPAFTQFDFGVLALTDIHPGPREDQTRFGRVAGWKARYRRSGTAETPGPLVVESRVDLFENEAGAGQDLDAYETELEQTVERFTGSGRVLEPPRLGEASAAITLKQGSGLAAVRFFTLAWQRGETTASLSVNGFEGRVDVEDALDLARKQDRRLLRALD